MDQVYQELADQISTFVNRHGSNRGCQGVAEKMVQDHPTLQQAKMRLFVAYVKELAKLPYADARNQASVDLAKSLVAQWGDGPALPTI